MIMKVALASLSEKITAELLCFLLLVVFFSLPKQVHAAENCTSFNITGYVGIVNNMPVFRGGENATIEIVGDSQSSNITPYWANAFMPFSATSSWNPYESNDTIWHQISGNYNPITHVFSGNFTIPTFSQEIIVAANNSSADGNFCSGDPFGKTTCTEGSYWVSGQPTACCTGCQKRIVVDPLFELNAPDKIDMREYFKFDPGNYWEYEGINYSYPASDGRRNFKSRIEIEPPMIACGHKAIPVRFLKNKASGYISAQYSYQTQSRWAGPYASRIAFFYFGDDWKWNKGSKYAGAVWAQIYGSWGEQSPDSAQYWKKDFGSYSAANIGLLGRYLSTSGTQHFYYAPYFFSPQFLPANLQFSLKRRDDIDSDFNPATTSDLCRFEYQEPYKSDYSSVYASRPHSWETEYGYENVTTPVFSGTALRIKFLEYDARPGQPAGTGFLLREDWILAKNVGLVMVKQKNLEHFGLNRLNCGQECENSPMINPELEIKATKSYLNQKLSVSSPLIVSRGKDWKLIFSDSYTGFTDIDYNLYPVSGSSSSGTTLSAWIEDGIVIIPGSQTQQVTKGEWAMRFRRHLPEINPANKIVDEQFDTSFVNNNPWSDLITVNFVDSSDLDSIIKNYQINSQLQDFDKSGLVNSLDFSMFAANQSSVSQTPTLAETPTPTQIPTLTPTLIPQPTPTPTSNPTPSVSPPKMPMTDYQNYVFQKDGHQMIGQTFVADNGQDSWLNICYFDNGAFGNCPTKWLSARLPSFIYNGTTFNKFTSYGNYVYNQVISGVSHQMIGQTFVADNGSDSWLNVCYFDNGAFGNCPISGLHAALPAMTSGGATFNTFTAYANFVFLQNGVQKLGQTLVATNGIDSWIHTCNYNTATNDWDWGSCSAWTHASLPTLTNSGTNFNVFTAYANYVYSQNNVQMLGQTFVANNGGDSWLHNCNYNNGQFGTCSAWIWADLRNL